jgi:hypothetical protein
LETTNVKGSLNNWRCGESQKGYAVNEAFLKYERDMSISLHGKGLVERFENVGEKKISYTK